MNAGAIELDIGWPMHVQSALLVSWTRGDLEDDFAVARAFQIVMPTVVRPELVVTTEAGLTKDANEARELAREVVGKLLLKRRSAKETRLLYKRLRDSLPASLMVSKTRFDVSDDGKLIVAVRLNDLEGAILPIVALGLARIVGDVELHRRWLKCCVWCRQPFMGYVDFGDEMTSPERLKGKPRDGCTEKCRHEAAKKRSRETNRKNRKLQR
jgi:hypothetical protein